MTWQERLDLSWPKKLECAIDSAAMQIAYPGEQTDVASYQADIAALRQRAESVAEAARKNAGESVGSYKLYWLGVAERFQAMADYAAHFAKGGKA
jgi:hypothetical protein